ncbi:NnrS family protein [Mariprofundus sp. EBB-1]|uniref:NnrS family protein n=1 Tax=Mariprofundus sp. EBB-1 TaxID=2650971 RepID=UPI000EF17859|nr:NnrS family protein [Mariprofundus sp. EBB-1]RLL50069.1 NnrS family protein [Mariprofundus sp. EBB-1]
MSGKGFTAIQISNDKNTPKPQKWAPLALGFRPFFLLGTWFAVLFMAISLAGFASGIWHHNYFDLPLWHAHEMVFGYAIAVIAGFLLTSVRNWTGLATPSGLSLGLLVLLWLAPRLFSALPFMPASAFAILDMLFLPTLAVILGRLILKSAQSRNYPIPIILLLLSLCNGAVHLEVLGLIQNIAMQAMQIAVCLIMALIALIGGRVIPFFMQGAIGIKPVENKRIEQLALPSILLVAVAIAVGNAWLICISALLAALIHAVRLYIWFDRAVLREPMLWILQIGYAWLVAGFIIYALAVILDLATMHAIHAWTVGGIGMFTLGMMSRVALGHTGRKIVALPWIPTAFILLFIATIARVALPLIKPELLDSAILVSSGCWLLAFIIVGIRYSSILLTTRVDGKPG